VLPHTIYKGRYYSDGYGYRLYGKGIGLQEYLKIYPFLHAFLDDAAGNYIIWCDDNFISPLMQELEKCENGLVESEC
jgi:hypothetical protein